MQPGRKTRIPVVKYRGSFSSGDQHRRDGERNQCAPPLPFLFFSSARKLLSLLCQTAFPRPAPCDKLDLPGPNMPDSSPAGQKLRFGVFEYDPQTEELRKRGVRIQLKPQSAR